jgi:hypothetical protein
MLERAKNSVRTFSWKLPKQKSSLAPDYVWSNSGKSENDSFQFAGILGVGANTPQIKVRNAV